MARQIAFLALIFFAVMASASASASASSSSALASPPKSSSIAPAADNNVIGTTDGSDTIGAAAPVGGQVHPDAFPTITPAPAPSSATILEASTVVGVIVTALVASFSF